MTDPTRAALEAARGALPPPSAAYMRGCNEIIPDGTSLYTEEKVCAAIARAVAAALAAQGQEAREPLTEAQIRMIGLRAMDKCRSTYDQHEYIVREAERHHGIPPTTHQEEDHA